MDYLNPSHENFFLRLAFIPDSDYMEDFIDDIKSAFNSKFVFLQQFNDTWDSIKNTAGKEEWEGIKYNNPIIGEVVIVSPIAINEWSYKIKFWIGGCVVLLTIVMTIRRIGGIAGGGHVS